MANRRAGSPASQRLAFSLDDAGVTHVGAVRNSNQDACFVGPDIGLWAVADGMGGHQRGEFASQTVVQELERFELSDDPKALAQELEKRLDGANVILRAEARRLQTQAVGSTVVAMLAVADRALIAWCGDSRAYLYRPGEGLTLLTRDHTIVQDLVEAGLIAAADAESHPQAHVLTQALGASEVLSLDFRQLVLRSGDTILLCSDGLTRCMDAQEIEAAIAHNCDGAAALCEGLIATSLDAGAPDNVTVVAVRML